MMHKSLAVSVALFALFVGGFQILTGSPQKVEAFTTNACYGTPYDANGNPTFYPDGSTNCFGLPPTNGKCSATHYNCDVGVSTSNVDGASSYTWTCLGDDGGTNASCSEAKPVCPADTPYTERDAASIAQYCAATGVTCGSGQVYVSSISCHTGGTNTWSAYGTACTAPNCTGCGCVTAPTPVNGVCSSTHYSCSSGTSGSNVSGTSSYTWSCNGSGGGTNASCSEAKINGSCSSTHYSCATGTSGNNVSGTSSYTWTCASPNGGTTASCSEAKSTSPAAATASLSASPTSVASGSRSTLTWDSADATSCTASGPWTNSGTLSGSGLTDPLTSNTTFYFQCTGPGGTSALKSATVSITSSTAACGTSSGTTPQLTEPTTNPAACNPGTYANSPADTTTSGLQAWNWSCTGAASSCSAPKYGCRTTTDSNYTLPQYGASGPNNNYGCAGTCANGYTNYPTCTAATSCAATTIGNCSLSSTSSGGSSGSCSSGYTGSCNYTCSNGTWSQSSNSCTASASCPSTYTDTNVTGQTGAGSVWGSSPYTDDSDLGYAAVHAGLISAGQSATIHRTARGLLASFTASTQNGVTTMAWDSFCGVTLSVVSTTPTATLSASPTSINPGQSSKLTWGSSNATSCTFADIGAVAKSGTRNVSPSVDSTYSITCSGTGGTSSPATATVTVNTPELSIKAVPPRVLSGKTTTISWNNTNVKNCSITKNGAAWKSNLKANGSNVLTGSATETITAQTTYSMTCTDVNNNLYSTAATVIVNIAPAFQEF